MNDTDQNQNEGEINGFVPKQGAKPEDLSPGQTSGGAPKPPADAGLTKPADDAAKAAEAKAAEEAAKAKEQEQQDEPDDGSPIEYVELQDPTGNAVIGLLKEAGVAAVEANAIFEDALKSGDYKKIKWDLLKSRLGDAKFVLAKQGIEQFYENTYKKNIATRDEAYSIVGGEENWKKVAAWVGRVEKADPARKAEFDEIRAGINAGGRMAKHAITDLKTMYEADPKNNGLGTAKVVHGERRPMDTSGQPLGRAEYLKLVKEAHEKRAPQSVHADLQARRRAGRAAGL